MKTAILSAITLICIQVVGSSRSTGLTSEGCTYFDAPPGGGVLVKKDCNNLLGDRTRRGGGSSTIGIFICGTHPVTFKPCGVLAQDLPGE